MARYHFYPDGSLFFVTFTIVDWLPVFVTESTFRLIVDSLNFCHQQKGLRINAYVIMPTHFHAIVFHESFRARALELVITDFRKFTGRQLADALATGFPVCFRETIAKIAGDDRERRFWQPSRHPEQIETEQFWQVKFDYLHDNPVRKGLVRRPENWRYSSASYWINKGTIENDVILSAIDW